LSPKERAEAAWPDYLILEDGPVSSDDTAEFWNAAVAREHRRFDIADGSWRIMRVGEMTVLPVYFEKPRPIIRISPPAPRAIDETLAAAPDAPRQCTHGTPGRYLGSRYASRSTKSRRF
jgi:hypothetical protein